VRFSRAIEVLRSEGPGAFTRAAVRHLAERAKIALRPAHFAELANRRRAGRELRLKSRVLTTTPREITIESTTFCNLQCVMCEHSQEGMVARRHFPEHLVERLAPYMSAASRFQLHSLGEPLMSPAFWKILERITSVHRGTPDISFNSNGLLLSEKNIALLLASKVREINISFDAATAETYQKIRGGDFERLVANVANLVRARAAARRADFKIILNMTLMRANIEELPQFVRLAYRVGADEVSFWGLNEGENYERPDWVVSKGDWQFSYAEESPQHYPNLFAAKLREAVAMARDLNMPLDEEFKDKVIVTATGRRADKEYRPHAASPCASIPTTISSDTPAETESIADSPPQQLVQLTSGSDTGEISAERRRIDGASGIPAPKSATISKCEAPWRWLVVNNRGDCLPCCFLQGTVGNLERQSVEEIWNGLPMQELRASIAQGEVHPLCQGASCRYVRGPAEVEHASIGQ
jgi:MoaA/NifB/PqqE/SkfB family radical SAM enzyme